MYTNARILFKLTTRSRPRRAFEVIQSVINHCTNPNFYILCTVDADDPTLQLLLELCEGYNVNFYMGESKSKIDAINRDVEKFPFWDILVNLSDDTKITRIGFDDIIRKAMYSSFPDLDGVLHFPDGNRKDLMTVSIIGRTYYMRDRYIYYPEYKNLWSDNEAVDVAKARGKYVFIDEEILDHIHPAWNKCGFDEQYHKTESTFGSDQQIYETRKQNNFGL